MGLVVTFAMLGGIVAQPIGALATALGSWRYAIILVAAVGLIFLILIFTFVRNYPNGHKLANNHSTHSKGRLWQRFAKALANWQNWLCGLYTNFLSIPIIVLGGIMG